MLETPITRTEQYLSAIAGNPGEVPEYPITREEQYLAAILEGGGSDGSGGTTDYEQLTNKPSINGVELSGNVELSAIMADTTPEVIDEAIENAGIEQAVTDAWNAAWDEGGG